MEGGSLPTLSNLEEAMKAEQKVIFFYLLYLWEEHKKHLFLYLWLFCYICFFVKEQTSYVKLNCDSHRYFYYLQ